MRHHRSLVLILAGSATVLTAQETRPLSPQERREIIRQHLDRDDDPRPPVGLQGRPVTDRADLRRDAMKQWWGEWTPEFRMFLLDSAKVEKLRYSHLMPRDPGGKEMALAASATGTWLNIGPTRADVAKNGGTSLNVSDSGRPRAIVVDPNNASIIYNATAGGGVWKTTNGGSSWTPITESLGSLSVGHLAMDPGNSSVLYLGLGDPFDGTGIGVVKSTDGGATWGTVQPLGSATSIRSLLVHPANSNIVLASTNAGVFRSADAGATWTVVAGATVTSCWDLAWAGGNNFVLSSEGSLFRSTDSGANWSAASGLAAGASRISVASAPSNRSILYAMAAKASASPANEDLLDIYKSTDGGATWTGLGAPAKRYSNTNTESTYLKTLLGGQGFYNHMIVVSPVDPNTAYFGGQLLLAKTTDGGSTFRQMSNWLAQFSLPYIHADFHAGAISADGNTVYAGTDGGIFKSTDAGATWTHALNVGITSHLIYSVSSSPASADAVLGGFQDNGTRVRSGSTGTFNQTLGGDGFGTAMHAANANTQLGTLYYARIYKSTDGGSNWTSASSGLTESNNSSSAPFITRLAVSPADGTGNTVYTFSNTKVYKSTNFAGSWTAMGTSGLPTTSFVIRNVSAAKNSASVVGIVANSGRVFLTANGGSSWTQAGVPGNNGSYMSCVAFDPADYNTVYTASVAPDGTRNHLWKSTNFGVSWTAIDSNGLPSGVPVNVVTVDPGDRNVLYAATHLGLYRSGDGGATWARWGSGLPLVNVTDVYVSPDSSRVRLATFGRGFWELQGAPTAPSITSHPASASVTAGQTATFTVSAGGTAPLSYQWFRNGASISGATASSYTTPATTLADSGSTFHATVTNSAGSATSNGATLTVTSAPNDELVLNGGFESGATSWGGTTGAIGTWTQQPAKTGTKNAWLCGNGSTATEYLTQSITVPSTATSATLTFWVHIDTAETTKSRAYDTLKVQVISGTTTTLATYSNLNKATGYVQKTFDLTSYKGKTITLKFLGAEDSTLQTSFVLDDVSVKVK